MSTQNSLSLCYKLPVMLAKTLQMMIDQEVVPIEQIEETAHSKTGRQTAYRLRKAMELHGINVNVMRSVGYWISPEDKGRINEQLLSFVGGQNSGERPVADN